MVLASHPEAREALARYLAESFALKLGRGLAALCSAGLADGDVLRVTREVEFRVLPGGPRLIDRDTGAVIWSAEGDNGHV